MKKRKLTFVFGISMLTFVILLTYFYYDKLLSELTTSDLLFFSMISTIAGAVAFGFLWLISFIVKKGKNIERPKLYNISGSFFLIFAVILYLVVRDIPLKNLEMSIFLSIFVFCIVPLIATLLIVSKKLSLLLTFLLSLSMFLLFLNIYYYKRMFLDLTTGDLLNFSIGGTIAGGIGGFLYWVSTQRKLGAIAGVITGAFLMFFAIILFIHTRNVALDEIYMATFISVLAIFTLFVFVPGLFVIILIYNYYGKRGGEWI